MSSVKSLIKKFGPSQGPTECLDLITKVSKIQPKVILEIGVHLGKSLALWDEAFAPEILIGIDTQRFAEAEELLSEPHSERTPARLRSNIHYLAPYNSGSTDTWNAVTKILAGRKVDFLFVDGDHRYEPAKHDYYIFGQLVRKGGIIAIHDVTLEGEQWNDLVETKQLFDEIETDKELLHSDGTGCGVCYV